VAAFSAAAAVSLGVAAVGMRVDPGVRGRLRALEPPAGGGSSHRADSFERLGRGLRRMLRGRAAAGAEDAGLPIGWPAGFGSDGLLGRRAAGAALGVLVAGVGAAATPGLVVMAPVLMLMGWRVPGLLARRAARARLATANAEIPNFLDLLAAASAAGLGAQVAVRRAAAATTGPLAQELASTLAAVDLGARWRDELRALSARLKLPDLTRAVHAIARTETLGASLSDSLRDLADGVRRERMANAAEAARKAPVKMLFPLVFMVLPAFLLLTVVPVLISTLRSIR
jgi:tight adherence protein C